MKNLIRGNNCIGGVILLWASDFMGVILLGVVSFFGGNFWSFDWREHVCLTGDFERTPFLCRLT